MNLNVSLNIARTPSQKVVQILKPTRPKLNQWLHGRSLECSAGRHKLNGDSRSEKQQSKNLDLFLAPILELKSYMKPH
jgi:hypothetical protein